MFLLFLNVIRGIYERKNINIVDEIYKEVYRNGGKWWKIWKYKKIEKLDNKILLRNLNELKSKNNNTYKEIATYLQCDISTCQRYFKGTFKIPIDRLILLSEFYNIDIDKMCGKE